MATLCRSTGTRNEIESATKPEEKVMLVYSQHLAYDAEGFF
jgi:hypothetical protein